MGKSRKPPEPKRVFESWEGRNLFCCDGRVISGPDRSSLVCTISLVLVPKSLFLTFVIPQLLAQSPVFAINALAAVLLLIMVIGAVTTCHCTDPGIIPRGPKGHKHHGPRILDKKDENGRNIRMRWCETCRLYRPPRAHHCRDCGNCVEVFDHHCPWVGNCVARRNYRYFLLFLFSTCFSLLHTFVMSLVAMTLDWKDETGASFNTVALCTILMVYCGVIFLPLICLASYHCSIVSAGETTKEEIKKMHEPGANPDDQGCTQNWIHTCWVSVPSSRLTNLREFAHTAEAADVELNALTVQQDERIEAPSHSYISPSGRKDGYAMITLSEEEEKDLCGRDIEPDQDLVEQANEQAGAKIGPLSIVVDNNPQGSQDQLEIESPTVELQDQAPLMGRSMDV